MQSLEPPDSHALSAAEGWFELGNIVEAKAELNRISEPRRNHPLVLTVHWMLSAHEKDWPAALEIAGKLVELAPEFAFSWLNRAYALRRAPGGGLQAAWDALIPALDRFPEEATVFYNLACYACQMRRPEDARLLLKQALTVGDKTRIKAMALKDSDLEPLWPEIRDL
jgi:tetratricopeptide (TPR) repeat protein